MAPDSHPFLPPDLVDELEMRRQRRALADALLLEQGGNGWWRIYERRVERGDGRFLAFVERKEDGFEVMQLADDLVSNSFFTMRDVMNHAVSTHTATNSRQTSRMLAWLG